MKHSQDTALGLADVMQDSRQIIEHSSPNQLLQTDTVFFRVPLLYFQFCFASYVNFHYEIRFLQMKTYLDAYHAAHHTVHCMC